ncbi:Isochorismatase hydrolase [Sanghuangporus baumii]|uniref:Isochorismatase hydrolase n=1 Tax=Sanghuangporus baumii TaxID=108892 RepID=A0A9Q5HYZ3_SANBA|nr:Isochorismatase hydrolase [Sanghuangporus baumii]
MPPALKFGFASSPDDPNSSFGSEMGVFNGTDFGRKLMRGEFNAQQYGPLFDLAMEGMAAGTDLYFPKNRLSGLWGAQTPMGQYLQDNLITTLFISGVNADQCVFGTFIDAFYKARHKFHASDATATSSPSYAFDMVLFNAKLDGFIQWSSRRVLKSIESTIDRYAFFQELDHLVVVPGHGVWLGNEAREAYEEDAWALEHYQTGEGARFRIETFVAHIRRGVGITNDDPKSLLVFSGGSTRHQTAVSESTSYFSLALALSFIQPTSPLPRGSSLNTYQRTATEDYALDSFQNLLFSIARFRTVTGHYPERITVVGYGMKEARFSELHRVAVRWPSDRWTYIGVDIEDDVIREEATKGELANGYLPYEQDLYGCHGILLAKRRNRNVHRKAHPYHVSAPEIAPLLEWCPSTESRLKFAPDLDAGSRNSTERNLEGLYDGRLPWSAL